MSRGTTLDGARVLITGGTSGVGRRLAQGAVARGATVVLWARDAERGERVRHELGERASFVPVDVSDAAAVERAAAATGAVDVLVNCAGVVTGKPLLEASEAEIRRTYEVNTLALYWVTRAFLPGMLARDAGTVVTVSSAAGLLGTARLSDYAGSKHAAVGFTESLRAELRGRHSGVKTLVVCPFFIDTGMFAGVRTRYPRLLPLLDETVVAGRILDAIERGSARLVLPPLVRLLPVLRALPVRTFDALVDVFGVNRAMDEFAGRAAAGQDAGSPS